MRPKLLPNIRCLFFLYLQSNLNQFSNSKSCFIRFHSSCCQLELNNSHLVTSFTHQLALQIVLTYVTHHLIKKKCRPVTIAFYFNINTMSEFWFYTINRKNKLSSIFRTSHSTIETWKLNQIEIKNKQILKTLFVLTAQHKKNPYLMIKFVNDK